MASHLFIDLNGGHFRQHFQTNLVNFIRWPMAGELVKQIVAVVVYVDSSGMFFEMFKIRTANVRPWLPFKLVQMKKGLK